MFEAHVLYLLRRYLGEYVEDLSVEALRISVWKGDVVLKDLKLKAEALNSLKLPVTVKAGFVGSITLKVPWKSLGKEPVIVLIDSVFVLAHPAPEGHSMQEEEREKLFEAKLHQIEEAELATLEATAGKSKTGTPNGGASWLGSLIATIIGNLKVSISNVHVRYEDSISNPGHPFCSGVTLSNLAAVTTDELGNESFDTSGALDKLRKSVQLQRLAVYHDSNSTPWRISKKWEDLNPNDWTKIFQDGIDENISQESSSIFAINRRYLISPINGILIYHRLGKQERHDPDIPFEKASLVLSDVSLTISEAQYYDGIKFLETFSRYRTRVDASHLRPVVSVLEDPHAWWRYAVLAGLQQKKMCYWFSWERIKHLCQLRRRYVQLYASSLQHSPNQNISEMRQIEKALDSKVILLWRLLAHAKAESVKSKEASQQKGTVKRSWWSFGWGISSGDDSDRNESAESQLIEQEKLTKEEWQAINKLLSYETDEDTNLFIGKDLVNMIKLLVDVSISQAAARIVNINQTEVLCGRFENLQIITKLYHKSVVCDLSLKYYGLSSPEGSLAQSVSSENKINALAANFFQAPIGEDVDWRLSASIAPCHVTVLMESYERFLEFLKRSNAVSPIVALETAAALQMKIEQVTRRAQEQLQIVLEEKSRFVLDIDFDAPKVCVPLRSSGLTSSNCHFLVDFGHFTLHTREGQKDEKRQGLYSRCYITGRDIAAFFVDSDLSDDIHDTLKFGGQPKLSNSPKHGLYSLVDRCGMSVTVDQIKIPHPSYPSRRISIEVPTLSMHFSPARYGRIIDLIDIVYGSEEPTDVDTSELLQTSRMPWHPVDLASDARILVWRGLGNSLAEWQSCHLVLSGYYLYVLDSELSQTYQKCTSMVGRHLFEVPPSSVGGSLLAIAVSYRGVDVQKALESSSTLIIEFQAEEDKNAWFRALVQATYQASTPPAPVLDILGDSISSFSNSSSSRPNEGSADLVVNGELVEMTLSVYGKLNGSNEDREELILELLASGGKVYLVQFGGELSIRTKLHSLKIKDALQGRLTSSPQYLAYSVLKDSMKTSRTSHSEFSENEIHKFDDDDSFTDALPDFMSAPDQCFYSPRADLISMFTSGIRDEYASGNMEEISQDQVKGKTREIFYEAHDNYISDFVVVTFVTRSPDIHSYDGIDTQMCVRMSALEFFSNRPTLVALIDFGLDLSLVNSAFSSRNMSRSRNQNDSGSMLPVSSNAGRKEENNRSVVKGLLGYGKSRVVFNLRMDIDSVCIFLNKEDCSRLAMFVQESFLLDLKVYPSSISIDGTLGNMRLCDMSLGPDHQWGWLCDIRNQGIESLIKFTFQSYSIDDDDYEGHDYSLSGHLSAVRIIFLYRFVQEITAYFMELASPNTDEAIKFVDKVGGFEWLIQKYELDGSSAVKLDLSLDTPIIIVPKNSTSNDYMQLDLGKLQINNSFSWHGCNEGDPSDVHLDILDAEIHGINMAIGVDGFLGKPMIRQGQGLHVQVRRSLRDVFRKLPTLAIQVQVGSLHGVMSDKEYQVILDCVHTNLSEEPKLPPSFRSINTEMKDSMRMIVDKVNLNSQVLFSRTVMVMAVEVHYALLELFNSRDEQSPLAQVALEDLWVSYRSTSLSEMDVYVTIPKFSVFDLRPDTKSEMRLMLGSYADAAKPENLSSSNFTRIWEMPSQSDGSLDMGNETNTAMCNLTMLVMDYRWRSSFHSFVIRIQQPRILVVLDFILAVAEYFVPSLGTITGREEALDPKNDPLTNSDDIILSESTYKQKDDVVHLSPRRQLIVDGCGANEFIYDGCGGTISLSEEFHANGRTSSGIIIFIGHGKKLRFRNVKIENAVLLKKCTYLSCDSSCSYSLEDGAEVSILENFKSGGEDVGINILDLSEESGSVSSSEARSFTFEAQVVSPELTFYDSSKLCFDDSLNIEKLLRAKMDFSFMYASKQDDTWVRSVVKDLTLESGSGLIILEPVDISAGYTSVGDKTNISVISSDICIRLSISVASLVLRLQSQALSALQFGNANPLSSCTNFKRIWVSQRGSASSCNLTFWRPYAPSNYVILGDCVTSRAVPPSQVVVAVNNIYGRARKPIGYEYIGSFSNFQDGDESESKFDSECSIWMPIAPPGYTAVGCVAHLGKLPPPNHIVYCLRSDLVTSANYSSCMYYIPSNSRCLSGFSIWRIANNMGTFYAHKSVEYPSKNLCLDLHQILLRNRDWSIPVQQYTKVSENKSNDYQQDDKDNDLNSSSGWDVLRTRSKSTNYCMSTPQFERIWWDKGSDIRRSISIWRPLARPGFAVLSDCVTEGLEPPALGIVFKCDGSAISATPVQFTKVAHVSGKGLEEAFFWYPIPPPGYASLGCVVTKMDEEPKRDTFCCPRIDLVNQTVVSDEPVSRSSSSKGSNCWSIWKVENQAYTFLARADLRKPSSRLAYNLSDYVKPRARENVNAEMKIGVLSVSILDSLRGTMTPLLDTTITNINLATHGRVDSMNAVLICSIAASTFNRQLRAWEPLVEPFDGIFKLETYDTSDHSTLKIGKRIRVAATTAVNINLSAANIDALTEAIVSWRLQDELEQKLSKKGEDSDESSKESVDFSFSALEEDDLQRVIIENSLGCDIYLIKADHEKETIERLESNKQASLLLPSPRFANLFNVVTRSSITRFYVAIQIIECKGIILTDDGNGHDLFCALRLLIDSQASDQYKLFPQSARTRCVKPFISSTGNLNRGQAKWNELFIFEVPEKGLASLEIEVTNLASKAGKGEVIGALTIPINNGAHVLQRTSSIRILQQAADAHQFSSYRLRKKGKSTSDADLEDFGNLKVSATYFERNSILNSQRGTSDATTVDSDVGFWVGLCPDGPWESFASVLPLSVVPKSLDKKTFALDVAMKGGRKLAILRSLIVVVNDADVKIEIFVCPATPSSNSGALSNTKNSDEVTEEIFENHRYQTLSGWVASGVRSGDPGHWSTRDYSFSSMNFYEPPLPHGWKWASAWNIEKIEFVDFNGWAYGSDFQTLKWPPSSSKASSKLLSDYVRRRRWVRKRQKLPDQNIDDSQNFITVINPGTSVVVPWRYTVTDADFSLRVRPFDQGSQDSYVWGQMVNLNSIKNQSIHQQPYLAKQSTVKKGKSVSSSAGLKLSQLEKNDMLVCCWPNISCKEPFWLSIGTDASVLNTELNSPIYDWKISISSAFRLENKLPYQADYAIWERSVEGNMVERQRGVVSSCGTAFVYSVDLTRSMHMTLFVQDGWVLEKDPVPILNLSSLEHASSFWMIQKQSNRRLRISVECDMGGSDAAPKTVRLFVPYWLQNETSIPLVYRLVEVEPLENSETDSLLISRAVKSAKLALKHSYKSLDRKSSVLRRNIQVLESIEDSNQSCVMLSPQDYLNRSGMLSSPSRGDSFFSARVGVSVGVRQSGQFSPGISLFDLESKERVDIKTLASDGSYYKLSVQLSMATDRTKVVRLLPQTLFINRTGRSLCLSQYNIEIEEWFHPSDPPKQFKWRTSGRNELLKMRLDGYRWSTPFTIESDGIMCVRLNSNEGNEQMYLKVEVRGGSKGSRYEVVFHHGVVWSPYRIENRSMFLPIRFRQVDGFDDSWRTLSPTSAAAFYWEDLGRQLFLEVLVDGADALESQKYNIDEVMDHQPSQAFSGPIKPLRVTVLNEGKIQIARISDWMPEEETAAILNNGTSLPVYQPSESDYKISSDSESEFHAIFELAELGLSVIDHTPEEILYLSVQNLMTSYSSGLGSGISRLKLRMQGIQVDNQLSFTPMPVLFRPQRGGDHPDYIIKFSLTTQMKGSLDYCVYPYLGLQGPENSGFLVNIHEPIIWRLHEMFQQVKLNRLFGSTTSAVSVDPTIQIGLLNISEIRFRVSMAMSPSQRPRGVLGFWSSLMTALGNTEHMPVRIAPRFSENICMRQSSLINTAVSNIQKDLLSQPLQLLSGVDILGNASSALDHMSKGVAALSMDKKFIQSRQKQDSKSVEDFGDVIREGGGALAKGIFRGFTGILTKPLEGAKSSGMEGFVQGVGKGIIGAAAQPVSGVLDFLSKTTEGANAVRMKIASAITSEEQLLRRRLPRVISGDNILRPYDEFKATGQIILQLAESAAFFGQVDLFKVRAKFALSDAYEDHFLLPKGKIVLVTHRRVLLVQQPANIIAQRKFNPARDPCTVLWDVVWSNLLTMELTFGKKDTPGSPPSRLILYLLSIESKENTRVIKCCRGSQQATNVYLSIEQALNSYGPHASKAIQKKRVTRPYTPSRSSVAPEISPRQASSFWSAQEVPGLVRTNPALGSVQSLPQYDFQQQL